MLITSMCFGNYDVLAEDNVKVTVNGNKLNFDQSPIIKDGRTLVPLRAIFEALGAEVLWLEDEQAVAAQSGDTTIVMKIGKNKFGKMTSSDDGVLYDLDVPPEVINGRTLVPARAVAEALDCSVNWDENTQTIAISSEKWIDGENSPTNAYIHNGVLYYNKSSNASSPTGEINTGTLAPESCAVCGGSDMVTCSYCRGTGKGQTISVIGMPTEQGCTYCGSTGKRLCASCNGSGQK